MFSDPVWYWLTFGFVLLVMAIFVTKKFNEIIFPLDDDLGSLLSGMSVASLSTRLRWIQGFGTYFVTYAFVFAGLCICQPLAAWAYNAATGKELGVMWASPAGPLLVASLLMGIVPNTPFFDYIERSIRRVAQRIAGIPEEIFDSIDDVKSVDSLNQPQSVIDPQLSQKIRRFTLIGTLLNVTDAEVRHARRSSIHCAVLGPWVHSDPADQMWPTRILTRLNSPRMKLSATSKQFDAALNVLLRDWNRYLEAKLNEALAPANLSFDELAIRPETLDSDDVQAALATFAEQNDEALADFRQRWLTLSQNGSRFAYQCDALFSLMAYSGEHKKDIVPPPIQEVIDAVRRQPLTRLLNPVISASLAAFGASMVGFAIFRLAKSYLRGEAAADLFLQSFNLAWSNAVALVFVFTVPVFVTVIARYWSQDPSSKPLFPEGQGVPYLKLLGVGGVTFVLSGMVMNIYYLGSQLLTVQSGLARPQITAIFSNFFSVIAVQQLALAIIGVMLAFVVCYIFDSKLFDVGDGRISRYFFPVRRVLFSIVVTAIFVGVFIALQVRFHATDYFTPKTIDGVQVKMYDNLVADCVSISIFLAAFLWKLLGCAISLTPYRRPPPLEAPRLPFPLVAGEAGAG